MPHPNAAPPLPESPPTDWPATDWPTTDGWNGDSAAGAEVGARSLGTDVAPEPWTTWQVAAVAVVGVLVGLTLGLAAGLRLSAVDPGGTPLAAEHETGSRSPAAGIATEPGSVVPDASAAPAPSAPAHDRGQPPGAGTLDDPVPLGSSFLLDGHSVRVLSVHDDAAPGIAVRIEIVFDGAYGGSVGDVEVALLDAGGGTHQPEACGTSPNPLDPANGLVPGAAVTGHLCFSDASAPGSVLVAEVVAGHPVHFDLA